MSHDAADTIVVIRHQGTIEYLRAREYITPDMPFIEHATLADVRGKHVIGMLPYHMAAQALDITVVDLEVPAELRGVELDVEQVERYATGVSRFEVFQLHR